MATRMQQRRGTQSQWSNANPILNAGEIGFESDTNKFKIGDGINHWADLSYFVDADTLIDGAPGLLDTLNELAAAIGDDPAFMTTVATNLSNHQSDTTNIHGITDTAELATKTFAAELLTNATKSNITITGNKDGLTITAENGVADSTTDNLTEGSTNKYFTDERAQDAVGNSVGTGLSYDDSTGAISVDTLTIATQQYVDTAVNNVTIDLSTAAGTNLDWNSGTSQFDVNTAGILSNPTISSGLTLDGTGDFTISADANIILDATTEVYIGSAASGNEVATKSYADTAASNAAAAIVDSAPGALNTLNELAAAINDDASYAATITNSLANKQDKVTGVSDTEIGYLDGVTSAIQTQLDAKAPLESPTFTGTVLGITKSMVGLGNVDDTSDANKPVSTATQTALDAKAPLASPTFTGTVTLPSGTVTSDMILDGTIVNADISATAAIAQSKVANLTTDLAAKAPLASPTFTGTVTIPNGAALGTPASATLTNATGLPVSGITSSTTTALGVGSIELGHATDTTLSRSSAGVLAVEGVIVPTISSTNTLTNKSLSASTTWIIDNTDATKRLNITTSGNTTNITGTLATAFTTAKTLTLPDATDTLVGRATTDTLTNKTISAGILTGTLTAGGAVGTNGQVLQSTGTGVQWGTVSSYSAPTIGSTSIASGATVTTIAGLTLGATSSSTLSVNTATTFDTLALASFTTAKYIISLKQGSKVRSSEVIMQTNGTLVDTTEFGLLETGGTIAGVLIAGVVSGSNALLQITVTDAATTNVTVKIQEVVM